MTILSLSIILLVCAAKVDAAPCPVPGPHATVQEAIDDTDCTEIQLEDQVYTESLSILRAVSIVGATPGTTAIHGMIEIQGANAAVALHDLRVESSCSAGSLVVRARARVTGVRLVVQKDSAAPCPALSTVIFEDGFESGNTVSWSQSVP